MGKHKITPTYILFYILFSSDTWRLVIGIIFSWLLAPAVFQARPMTDLSKLMIYLMLAAIGYAFSGKMGTVIADFFKRMVLKGKR